ncbi:hypothetical protein [Acinetobacter sp. ANC 5502]
MRFSKVALLSALAHGIGFGSAMSIHQNYDCSPFAFNEPSPSTSKQNRMSQKKRRLNKRRLRHK